MDTSGREIGTGGREENESVEQGMNKEAGRRLRQKEIRVSGKDISFSLSFFPLALVPSPYLSVRLAPSLLPPKKKKKE